VNQAKTNVVFGWKIKWSGMVPTLVSETE
jgi:hypothetical protein